jgi:hypothetical protein
MEKTLKFLYETFVKKQVNESVTEPRQEGSETVQITRTVKKVKPVKFAILKPDRRLYKDAEIFYARTLADYLKKGLLPYSLVAKRYSNDGGPLTDSEKKHIDTLTDELGKLQVEFYGLANTEDLNLQKRKNEILIRINRINTEVSNIQNAYTDIFDSTAEMKARNDSIEWWVMYLMYGENEKGELVPTFSAGDYEERIKTLENIEDEADPFKLEAIKKLSYLISFWFTARNAISDNDFKSMDRLYSDTMTIYKVEESGESVKVDEVSPPITQVPPV